jgi:hypothetical protein
MVCRALRRVSHPLLLALIVIGVIAAVALVFVAIARTLDRLLPDETATDEAASSRRWRRLPGISDQ